MTRQGPEPSPAASVLAFSLLPDVFPWGRFPLRDCGLQGLRCVIGRVAPGKAGLLGGGAMWPLMVRLLLGNLLSSLMGSSEQEGEDSQDDSSPIELD